MSELLRFRMARSPQRIAPDPLSLVFVERAPMSRVEKDPNGSYLPQSHPGVVVSQGEFVTQMLTGNAYDLAQQFVDSSSFVQPWKLHEQPTSIIHQLDIWLTQHQNVVHPQQLDKALDGKAADLVYDNPSWWEE